jgi:1-acyl-sn-glycerol-3-phosphate acyltransferase
VLQRGELFGIFPEGTRSRDGLLHKGHTGAARLAVRAGCPIIPVGITGTREIQPPDARMPRVFMPAAIRFGRPIDPTGHAGHHSGRLLLRYLTDELMYEISQLSGQPYVDRYATKRAEDVPTDVAHVPSADEACEPYPQASLSAAV